VPLYTIGVDGVKGLLYSRLRVTAAGAGYVHLPADRPGFDEEYIQQLTAEKLVTRYKYGVPSRHWVQIRPRNEALDTFVLALAALRLLNPKLELLAERVRAATVPTPDGSPAPPPGPSRPAGRRIARSGWMGRGM
jgi:phage terminase large subunit GpA-like protein